MGKRVNPAFVGAFVLGAIGLIVVAVVLFGSGKLFTRTHEYVVYFAGDVNGLRPGAAVKFKGVEIGQVSRIRLRLEQRMSEKTGVLRADARIPVIIALDEEKIVSHGGTALDLNDPRTIPTLIQEGLRAQLGMDSFVTGLLYVALEIQPNTPIKMVAPQGSPLQEIPSIPTPLEQAQSVATRIIDRLDKVDFAALMQEATATLSAIKGVATSPELKDTLDNLGATRKALDLAMADVRKTLSEVNSQIVPLSTSIHSTSDNAGAAMLQAKATLGTVQTNIAPGSPLNYQIIQTLQDVSAAARSIKELTDYLQRNPSSIVRGRDLSQE